MSRSKGILAVFALTLMLAGCSSEYRYVLFTPKKQVYQQLSYDQSFNTHIANLPKGPTVEGSDCGVVYSVSAMKQMDQNAFQEAIEKAGPPFDALINATQTSSAYFAAIRCTTMKGIAIKYEEYYAAEKNRTSQQ
jgi:hypothetical protein